eukprot:FR739935.1.p1 GENE.FR739935.1~~FR739935.1.p1  ORF type:complete len:109 (+),score=10.05 FR739935.1:127-453(+)
MNLLINQALVCEFLGMSSICSRISESLDEKNPHAVVQQVLSTTTSAHKGTEAWVGALDCGTTGYVAALVSGGLLADMPPASFLLRRSAATSMTYLEHLAIWWCGNVTE